MALSKYMFWTPDFFFCTLMPLKGIDTDSEIDTYWFFSLLSPPCFPCPPQLHWCGNSVKLPGDLTEFPGFVSVEGTAQDALSLFGWSSPSTQCCLVNVSSVSDGESKWIDKWFCITKCICPIWGGVACGSGEPCLPAQLYCADHHNVRMPRGCDRAFAVPKTCVLLIVRVLKLHSWSASGQEDKSDIYVETVWALGTCWCGIAIPATTCWIPFKNIFVAAEGGDFGCLFYQRKNLTMHHTVFSSWYSGCLAL